MYNNTPSKIFLTLSKVRKSTRYADIQIGWLSYWFRKSRIFRQLVQISAFNINFHIGFGIKYFKILSSNFHAIVYLIVDSS